MTNNQTTDQPRYVVGIGASAGGLESLEKLFRNLSPHTGMAFVVLQHLSPDFKSMMYELLGRDTAMTIHRAEEGMVVEANSVYLLPPKKEMTIQGGRLRVTDRDPSRGFALPIDLFLESLACDCGPRAIAIILSGSGSDGSRGVVAVAKHGGFVVSESTQTAKFDGMPASAEATGIVDEVLAPEEIGSLLVRIATEPIVGRRERIAEAEMRLDNLQGMDAIYHLFRRSYEIDFSVYKDTTVMRRVHRRIAMLGLASVDQYAVRLTDEPLELESLYSDLLIGVTQFFRDPDTYDILSQSVFPELVKNRDTDRPLRAWTSGCATGEEAYSLAIALHETFESVGQQPDLKLFATDVHKRSLEHAGRGIYSRDVMQGVSQERLEKYFVRRDDGYQVTPEIRKSIVFAPHNVLSDAPFTDLDFVSCRNLLIYFQSIAQLRALSMFHYALNKGGYMLLGGSESPGELHSEFDVIHERYRIYRKRRQVRLPNEFRAPLKQASSADLHASAARVSPVHRTLTNQQQFLHDQLLNRFMPPSLLIDENRHLVDSFGGAEKFLRLRARQPSLDVLDLMDESLRATLSGAIGRTSKDSQPVRFSSVKLRFGDVDQAFNLTVTPLTHPSLSGKHHVISFELLEARAELDSIRTEEYPGELDVSRDHIRQLEDDLRYSRENLQSTIEELETSNEELQATNEELIASNEELQSTNEELHSVNEELYTVNAEHQRKIGELAELNQDMHHLLENTDVATIFLDSDLRVRRFTSKVTQVFDLVEHDIGRSIQSFLPRFAVDNLVGRLTEVIHSGVPQEFETLADDGTCYLLRLLPYRINDDIGGVVLMLVDMSPLEVLRDRLRWMSAIVESTDDAIIGLDLNGMITSWNTGAEQLYGYSANEATGQHVSLIIPAERQSEIVEYHAAIQAGERLHTRDTIRIHRDGSELHVSLTISPVYDRNNQLIGISKIARDVSGRIAMEAEIRNQVKQREAFLATLSHELRNPLGAALSACRLIQDPRTDEPTRKSAAAIVDRQIAMTRTLLADLLDVSRLTQGKAELKLQRLDLRSLVDLIRETTLSEADDHQQEITWVLPSAPVFVLGDATRLVQIQVNLIHNALKYSPEHSEVRVVIEQRDSRAMIAVTDHGVGIPAAELENIFQPFVQIGNTKHQSEGGLGVGLTLVRSLVEAHGGEVTAESEGLGCGTTVRVWLPLSESDTEPSDVQDGPAGHGGQFCLPSDLELTVPFPTPLNIVLVEDIDDSRAMLESLLRIEGHTVVACGDGETGAEAILMHRPHLALVDIGLPGIDGYEVARRVRGNQAGTHLKLIALTGFGQPQDVERALQAGFDSHLVKPIEPRQLLAAIQTWASSSSTRTLPSEASA
jgi:two-component system CheB/CheR fusion protein